MLCRNHVEVAEGVRRCARCQVPFCPDCLVEIQGRPYCATCKTEQLMDVRSGVDRTLLPYASPWKRLGAIILDGLLINLPLYLVFIVLSFVLSDTPGEPHPMIIFASIPLLFAQLIYEGLMLSMKDGQTLGKLALKVRVVRADGSPITAGQAWGRAGMKFVFTSCLSIIDYIPAFLTQEKTTLHDMVANTRVIDTY